MDSFQAKLNKITKRTRNYLVNGILFIVFAIICFSWAYYINESVNNTNTTLHDLISQGSKEDDRIVELTVVDRPFVFAEYDNYITSGKYYFLMDEDYLYIGYLDYETYKMLNQDDISENPITIQGVTMIVPDDVIDIAIDVYNEEIEEDVLTRENYREYIGEICIDTVSDIADNLFQIVLGASFGFIGIIYLIIYYVRNYKLRKMKTDVMLWEQIKIELEHSETIDYNKFSLCLGPHYIIDGTKGLTIIPYTDIVWIYLHEHRYKGITNNRCLIVVTKDNKRFKIAELGGFHLKVKNTYLEIMENIYTKNQSILVGHTKKNKELVKNLYQIK